MNIPIRLRVGLQVTGSYFGIFAWLVAEYFSELRNSLKNPRSHFEDEIQKNASLVPEPPHPPDLETWVDHLSPWERHILLFYYHEGLNFKQIGMKTGMDAREVEKIHANLLYKIREFRAEETTGTAV